MVFTDLSLPDSQGLETFRAIHARSGSTAIVVLSGLADDTTAIQAVAEGAQDYLVIGIGLGLPVAARIIGWHKGQITVRSVPGEGSTFAIWLPGVGIASDMKTPG